MIVLDLEWNTVFYNDELGERCHFDEIIQIGAVRLAGLPFFSNQILSLKMTKSSFFFTGSAWENENCNHFLMKFFLLA